MSKERSGDGIRSACGTGHIAWTAGNESRMDPGGSRHSWMAALRPYSRIMLTGDLLRARDFPGTAFRAVQQNFQAEPEKFFGLDVREQFRGATQIRIVA